MAGIELGAGVTIESGVTLGSIPGFIVPFSAFTAPLVPGNQIEDGSGSFSGFGFTINDGAANGSGVAMANVDPTLFDDFVNSGYFTHTSGVPFNTGYIWNVAWGAGSTYTTTPVALYNFNTNTLVYWILTPGNYTTPISSGTFNFPATFTSTSTPTTFNN